ncbi:MAG: hypothetical protein ACFFCV_13240 [Promethearchaeota archaeon]
MKFEVKNKDYAEIKSQPFKNYHWGFLIMSVGGVMGILIGLLFAIYPYVDPLAQYLIPNNLLIAIISFVITAISIYIGNKYMKLESFLAINRLEGIISKFENHLFGNVEKKEVYEWKNIENVEAKRYFRGDDELRPWGGAIYFMLMNRKNVESISGKGNIPEKIVQALLKFMKNPDDNEEDEIYQPGFIIEE